MMEAVARDNYKYDYDYRAVKFSEYVDSIRQGIWLPNSERDKYFGLFCQSCEPPGIYRYTNGLEMVTRYPDIAEDMGLERIGVPQGWALALVNGGEVAFPSF